MRAYHFTKDIRKNFYSFYRAINATNSILCFDFEDSISDDYNDNLIHAKNEHRNKIIQEIRQLESMDTNFEFGFRINKNSSENYKDDIKALNSIVGVQSIFIPKVESNVDLENVLKDIVFPIEEIIPVIETQIGFDNIEGILSLKDSRIQKIAFGHCDYNLSLGNFPFFHHDSSEYWEWIQMLNEICKKADVEIINSPVLGLDNEELMIYNLKRSMEFSQVTGQISLCKRQTELIHSVKYNMDFKDSVMDTFENEYQSIESVLSTFENYRIKGKSFSIDANRRIISPHEIQMASLMNEVK